MNRKTLWMAGLSACLLAACAQKPVVPDSEIARMTADQLVEHAVRMTGKVATSAEHQPDDFDVFWHSRELMYTIDTTYRRFGLIEAERVIAASYAASWITPLNPCCLEHFKLQAETDPVVQNARSRYLGHSDIDDQLLVARSLFQRQFQRDELAFPIHAIAGLNRKLSRDYNAARTSHEPWTCAVELEPAGARGWHRLSRGYKPDFAKACLTHGGAAATIAQAYLDRLDERHRQAQQETQRRKDWRRYLEGDEWESVVTEVRRSQVLRARRVVQDCDLNSFPLGPYMMTFVSWSNLHGPAYMEPTKDPAKLRAYAENMLKHREGNYIVDGGTDSTSDSTPFVFAYVAAQYCR